MHFINFYFYCMKKDCMYETPCVNVIEVEVEKGFAVSNTEGFGDYQ